MKNILKKNQVIISAIAIMLIAAGYMNYTANTKDALQASALADSEQYAGLGDAKLVSANVEENVQGTELNTETNNATDTASNTASNNTKETNATKMENNNNNIENNTNIETTSNTTSNTADNTTSNEYFTESRLEREKMYSQMLESYQNILENSQISETQKEISQNEIKNINDQKNAIMIAENLIKNKGFEDVLIFVNGESVSVIIKGKEITPEQIAQIQNIVSRELSAEVDNIHISNKE